MSAKVGVVCDGLSTTGVRLTTLAVTCSLPVVYQLKAMRDLSVTMPWPTLPPDREVKRLIDEARSNPVLPQLWSSEGPIDEFSVKRMNHVWLLTRDGVCDRLEYWTTAKHTPSVELARRLLAPWLHVTCLVTATEWADLMRVATHPAYDKEIADVAREVQQAMQNSKPNTMEPGQWYLPFLGTGDIEAIALAAFADISKIPADPGQLEGRVTELCFRLSASRCMRFCNGDDAAMNLGDEVKFYEPLFAQGAVFDYLEHLATPDFKAEHTGWWATPAQHGNFIGWRQHRKSFVGERRATNRAC